MRSVESPDQGVPQEVKVEFVIHGTVPSGYARDDINNDGEGGHGITVIAREPRAITDKEERIRNDWIEKGIAPPEGSGYEIDSNNFLRRTEDLDREERQLRRLERELEEILIPRPDPVAA